MANTTALRFDATILLFSVLCLCVTAASRASYRRPIIVGGHHADLSVSAGHGVCPRTRAATTVVLFAANCRFDRRPLPHAPGVAPSAGAHHHLAAACALEEDEEEYRKLSWSSLGPPPRLAIDRGIRLFCTLPNGNRFANYTTLLLVEERPPLAANFVVDPARTGLLSSNRSSPVYKQNPSASQVIVLIVPANASSDGDASCRSEERLSAHCSKAYCSAVFDEQEQFLEYSSASPDRITPVNDNTIKMRRERLRYRERHRASITLPVGKDSYKIRRLLTGSHSQIAPMEHQHVAIHRQVRRTRRLRASVAIGCSALLGLICTVVAGVLLWCTRRKRLRRQNAVAAMAVELEELKDDEPILKAEQYRGLTCPRRFRYREMAAATCNFAEDSKIGRGGFGPVYRGYLNDEDRHVAIKVLTAGEQSQQGLREFQAEVTVMTQLRHRNIVQLLGWCDCRRGLFLVYELMTVGSLDKHLYDNDRLLTWPDRYNIALGLGSALQYLHQDCDRCVVHGDIKPANVMLDASGNAKLGDFGLARLIDHGAELRTTQVVAGTMGYIDPEFVNSHRPSAESDVYSFGVVLLEIGCGRRPASSSRRPDGTPALLNFVRGMYDRGTVLDAADGRLNGEFDEKQMERVLVTGLWCAYHDATRRPSVAQAVEALRSESAVLAPARIAAERSLVEQAYGDLSDEFFSVAPATAYLTSRDSTYLLRAEE